MIFMLYYFSDTRLVVAFDKKRPKARFGLSTSIVIVLKIPAVYDLAVVRFSRSDNCEINQQVCIRTGGPTWRLCTIIGNTYNVSRVL